MPRMRSDRFGTHRVLEPLGVLPQAAWRLDNDMSRLGDDEVLLDVETLNVAGSRESRAPGIGAQVKAVLIGALGRSTEQDR